MTEAPQILLNHQFKRLKLPTILREYDKQARLCAAEGRDHVQFLARLIELELIDRERRMIECRIKAAKFPATKNLPSHDLLRKSLPGNGQLRLRRNPVAQQDPGSGTRTL